MINGAQIAISKNINGIDIHLIRVWSGKRKGWVATWCKNGKDPIKLIEERHKRLLALNKQRLGVSFNPHAFDTYSSWFPGATTEAKAKRHFNKMCKLALTMNFEPS